MNFIVNNQNKTVIFALIKLGQKYITELGGEATIYVHMRLSVQKLCNVSLHNFCIDIGNIRSVCNHICADGLICTYVSKGNTTSIIVLCTIRKFSNLTN